MKGYYFRRLGLVVLTGVFFILMMPQLGFCNGFEGGPPEGFNFFGPAIVGDVIIIPTPDTQVTGNSEACSDGVESTLCDMSIYSEDARCRGAALGTLEGSGFLTAHDFADLVADNFEGVMFNRALFDFMPDKCRPQSNSDKSPEPYDNIINSVTKFENTGSVINASVVIMFIVQE